MKDYWLTYLALALCAVLGILTIHYKSVATDALDTLEGHLKFDAQFNNGECEEQIYEMWDNEVPQCVKELDY